MYNRVFRGISPLHKGFLAIEYGNGLRDLVPSFEMGIGDSLGLFPYPSDV